MESSNVKNKSSGKRKMSSEDTRSYFAWNLEIERVLADVLRDQRNLGNKDNVKNHFKLWRTWYGIVSDILSQSGFDWNSTKYMITVENEIAWNEYVKDRATGLGAENALDVDDIMSKETNEEEAIHSASFDLEGSSSATRKNIRPRFEMEAKNKVKIEDSTTESPTSVLEDENWWDFGKMDFFMLITTYGKLGDFNGAEKVLGLMNKNGYAPNVVSQTALMEAYGKGGRYNNAEAIFRRMQKWGLEPSAFTYQIILKTFVHGNKFREAEELFDNLLNDENSPLKPD
ncbi:hypothetical protein JHK85_012736 [Glycine max]|nr:hypothetical protein JHK85_012736 [Glycine max]KAG5057406.1 hypothetical protein JHK86_012402 [Glycine max]